VIWFADTNNAVAIHYHIGDAAISPRSINQSRTPKQQIVHSG
jgi:hypothetical protein